MKHNVLIFLAITLVLVTSGCQNNADTSNAWVQVEQVEPSYRNLMPVPASLELQKGKFYLDDSFQIVIQGEPDKRLYAAIGRTVKRLSGRTGLFLPQVFFDRDDKPTAPQMIIEVKKPAEIQFGMDEAYQLDISEKRISLKAETDVGALRGLETFLQLLDADAQGYFLPALTINDSPRFPWRGLLIDACRHFMPVDVIKRNLDGMAAVKLNVLHWHLTEDQGFRVESKTHPKLHELGSDGFYYTHEQIKDVIAYAADRGIRVIPEFDLPGHATSWLVAYPELASAPGPYAIERKWGIMDPTFNPAIEETYIFLDAFLKEMTSLFTDDYVHIGGDENKGHHWDKNEKIQAFKQDMDFADNAALQNYFNQRLLSTLKSNGKKMIGWDEILHEDMPKDIVLQSWRGREAMITAAQRGYRSLLSNGYYIDLHQPTDYHYLNDPLPPDSPLNEREQTFILGGEATMWAEFVSPEIIDSRIWPRTAAIAERFWSASSVRDVDDMYRRLKITSFHLEELGLTHEKNYPMMLRRLTGNRDVSALKTLVDAIESVKTYNRNRQRTHFSYTPLTRVIDAARPDAEVARLFRNDVTDFLENGASDKTISASLIQRLQLWASNHEKLLVVIEVSPILHEIRPMSENLSAVAKLGLEAMMAIESGDKAGREWLKQSATIIEQAGKPVAQTELRILPAIEALVGFVE
jgi:hexosaminidase